MQLWMLRLHLRMLRLHLRMMLQTQLRPRLQMLWPALPPVAKAPPTVHSPHLLLRPAALAPAALHSVTASLALGSKTLSLELQSLPAVMASRPLRRLSLHSWSRPSQLAQPTRASPL